MEKNSLITATKIATIIAVDLSALGITYKVESVLPQYGLDRLQGISSLIFLIGIVGVQIWLLSN